MAIRGLEGNQNAQPRVFAHDALDLQESGYVLGASSTTKHRQLSAFACMLV